MRWSIFISINPLWVLEGTWLFRTLLPLLSHPRLLALFFFFFTVVIFFVIMLILFVFTLFLFIFISELYFLSLFQRLRKSFLVHIKLLWFRALSHPLLLLSNLFLLLLHIHILAYLLHYHLLLLLWHCLR